MPKSLPLVTKLPSEKYFENAPKFKYSPQNNGISAALQTKAMWKWYVG
jgi:hypothetical protein